MIFVVAFFVIAVSGWILAGFVSDALMKRRTITWLAVPAAVIGSLFVSWMVVLALMVLGLATSEPFAPGFGSWVVTSWAGVLAIPVVVGIAIQIVRSDLGIKGELD
jgi:hypothetical protein